MMFVINLFFHLRAFINLFLPFTFCSENIEKEKQIRQRQNLVNSVFIFSTFKKKQKKFLS